MSADRTWDIELWNWKTGRWEKRTVTLAEYKAIAREAGMTARRRCLEADLTERQAHARQRHRQR